jgi:hypothetical protein
MQGESQFTVKTGMPVQGAKGAYLIGLSDKDHQKPVIS